MRRLRNDLSHILLSVASWYAQALPGRNLPGDNFHTIVVAPLFKIVIGGWHTALALGHCLVLLLYALRNINASQSHKIDTFSSVHWAAFINCKWCLQQRFKNAIWWNQTRIKLILNTEQREKQKNYELFHFCYLWTCVKHHHKYSGVSPGLVNQNGKRGLVSL